MGRAYYCGNIKDYKKRQKKYKRNWHRSEFNNPFFSKSKAINLKPYLFFLLFSAIIVISSYFFLFFDYWRIDSVIIKTQNQSYRDKIQNIIDSALNSKVLKILNGNNYFLFNSTDVQTKIEDELLVENLEIQKKIPNEIVVNFNEIKPSYIWIQGKKFYNVDKNGLVIDEIISIQQEVVAADSEIGNINNDSDNKFNFENVKKFLQNSDANLKLPIIYNESDEIINSKEFIKNKVIFQTINDLNLKIIQQANINVILYKLNADNLKKIEVITDNEWKILFNPNADLAQQCENLYSLMQKTFKETNPSEYIDLRYGNKVYYK